jgi:hypothetical protein
MRPRRLARCAPNHSLKHLLRSACGHVDANGHGAHTDRCLSVVKGLRAQSVQRLQRQVTATERRGVISLTHSKSGPSAPRRSDAAVERRGVARHIDGGVNRRTSVRATQALHHMRRHAHKACTGHPEVCGGSNRMHTPRPSQPSHEEAARLVLRARPHGAPRCPRASRSSAVQERVDRWRRLPVSTKGEADGRWERAQQIEDWPGGDVAGAHSSVRHAVVAFVELPSLRSVRSGHSTCATPALARAGHARRRTGTTESTRGSS